VSDWPTLLGWASTIAAVAAIAVYFYVVLRRPRLIRFLNGLGLFLTGLALFQGATIIRLGVDAGQSANIAAAVTLLILAVAFQAWAALRNRTAWDGVDRRGGAGGA
jgi:hypothetical protein